MKDIDFTFGIITDASPASCGRLTDIIQSIKKLNVPRYEVVLVGSRGKLLPHFNEPMIKIVDFDETIKEKWITRKKNLITQNANYDNVVYSHDYIIYDANWYQGWKEFGDDYHACMNRIINIDGSRFRDWTIFDDYGLPEWRAAAQYSGYNRQVRENLLPYDENGLNKFQYLSGTYWVAKKSLMQEMPQDENLVWGQGEDLVWSYRVRSKYKFSMNAKSTVQIHHTSTNHQVIFSDMTPKTLSKIKEYIAITDRR